MTKSVNQKAANRSRTQYPHFTSSGTDCATRRKANHIYFSATLEAATWGAELAQGKGPGRIYIVEPTGPFVDDPNLTDKKFPGNPTKSYRSKAPMRIVGEVKEWQGHSADALKTMR